MIMKKERFIIVISNNTQQAMTSKQEYWEKNREKIRKKSKEY